MSTGLAGIIPSERERELAAVISAYNDVTERLKRSHDRLAEEVRRLRDQLDEKNRELTRRERLAALGEMAAGVAHEIRNPLSGINLFASILSRDLSDRPESQRLAERISGGVRALDGIVGDILVFAGQSAVEARAVRVDRAVEAVLELAEARRQAQSTGIFFDRGAIGALVMADADQLERALLNVVLNAIDAAGPGGQVWIAVDERTEGLTSIEVADDGPGVDPDCMDRIFNPFFTTKETGTGLGLAIVHRILEAHGGRVEVGSRPGGGAVFGLFLRTARGGSERRGLSPPSLADEGLIAVAGAPG